MEIAKLKTQAQGKEREIAEEEARIAELQKAQKDVSGRPPPPPPLFRQESLPVPLD